MKGARVHLLLTLTILVMAVLPMLVSLYLLDDALRTSLNLGFSPRIVRALDGAAENLRTLGRLDPARSAEYRAQFEDLQELKQVYSDPEFVKQHLMGSLKLYFGIGLGLATLLSVGVASLLSRRIARSHAHNIAELTRERDKVRYLQEMSSWQELAKMLAHEIKNPLTPIEVLVTSLSKAYLSKGQPEFLAHLAETQAMVNEELNHLKSTVNKFSEFARMPQVQLAEVDLVATLEQQTKTVSQLGVQMGLAQPAAEVRARVDVTLFRQVLANLARNAIEANLGRSVTMGVSVTETGGWIEVRVGNDGVPVPEDIVGRMFDPYISTKSGKDNMGLGLAIVKKIVLEHGGDIRYEESAGHPLFVITLPRLTA
jgi:signal transduction histidine kinase